jgi:hypothetical protein
VVEKQVVRRPHLPCISQSISSKILLPYKVRSKASKNPGMFDKILFCDAINNTVGRSKLEQTRPKTHADHSPEKNKIKQII